ncbi:kinesin-related protein 3-like isoform X3 [Zophobas morio]|uniref:kinesin-related protein 3-like isoform X3 n=1 Tax=Zophobas morio TaxID=2755281 RepID=UPI00308338FD
MTSNIKVMVRFRPLNNSEINSNKNLCVHFVDNTTVLLKDNSTPFIFDHIFASHSTQSEVFDKAAKNVVEDILAGYNGTVFAYGQTSSGKSFTMFGSNIEDYNYRGVIPRVLENVFTYMEYAPVSLEFSVKFSFIEIYLEKIRDLLDIEKTNLSVHENSEKGVYIKDATELYVSSVSEVMALIKKGLANRKSSPTRMNISSSRSHSVLLITVSQKDAEQGSTKVGRLSLVDLAGSEKVSKSEAQGLSLEEVKAINKSLSTLGLVIYHLTDDKSVHVPYRDSKLTRILQESLGGNARTTILITCSPSIDNACETSSSLRFGSRAKKIRNTAKVNKLLTKFELTKLLVSAKEEIRILQRELESLKAACGAERPSSPRSSERDFLELTGEGALSERLSNTLEDSVENYKAKTVELNKRVEELCCYKTSADEKVEGLCITVQKLLERDKPPKTILSASKKYIEKLKRKHLLEIKALEEEHSKALCKLNRENQDLRAKVEWQQDTIYSLESENSKLLEQLFHESCKDGALRHIEETFEKLVCEKERIELVASELRCQLEESRGELNSKVEFTKRLLMQRREVGKTIRKLTRVIEKLVEQNAQLKFYHFVAEKRLVQKVSRITNLEKRLVGLGQQRIREELEYKLLASRHSKVLESGHSSQGLADETREQKIAKIIRGAGRLVEESVPSSPSQFWSKKNFI